MPRCIFRDGCARLVPEGDDFCPDHYEQGEEAEHSQCCDGQVSAGTSEDAPGKLLGVCARCGQVCMIDGVPILVQVGGLS